jgi:hypothetical protein
MLRPPVIVREVVPVRERIVERIAPPPVVAQPPAVHTREVVRSSETRAHTIERVVESSPRRAEVEKPAVVATPAAREAPAHAESPAVRASAESQPTATRADEPRTITIIRNVPKQKKPKVKKPVIAAPAQVRPRAAGVATRATAARTGASIASRPAPRIEIQIGTIEIRTSAQARRIEPTRIAPRHHTLTLDGDR